ncbi:MAG: anhydro-N-acetylmuramic acid kinase [Oscillatoriales cyanobacterium]|nr:MAG: anhydro-N-acetylmuramic acid kinase [Oscillatoriales cyanobacterium]
MRAIGLMSGTSVDGIDAALVELSGQETDLRVELIAAETFDYSATVRSRILQVCAGESLSMAALAALDDAIAQEFAQAALRLRGDRPVDLIGSHGQTVFHRPPGVSSQQPLGYSLQLGRGSAIAHWSGITTVSNFRVGDLAVGGQGAPLVPRVDAYLLGAPQESRCVQNIGGIGNVTYLPARGQFATLTDWETQIRGWDTGPGNVLIDLAVQRLTNGAATFDRDGAWAAQGQACELLVDQWLSDPFFAQAPPKSTGREYFGMAWLDRCWEAAQALDLSDADFLASLTALTAASIARSYRDVLPQLPDRVLLCGGGSRNPTLKTYLQTYLGYLGDRTLETTDDWGLSADSKEAIAFAVLGYWRLLDRPGNLPTATGARQSVPLGEVWPVPPAR